VLLGAFLVIVCCAAGVVHGCLGRWSFRRCVAPRHTAIDDEVGTVDEAALIAGEEEDTLCLLDGLTKATCGEVNFAAVALGCVVTEPVLQKRCAVIISLMLSDLFMIEHTSVVQGRAH
jgi:hypothetical protein